MKLITLLIFILALNISMTQAREAMTYQCFYKKNPTISINIQLVIGKKQDQDYCFSSKECLKSDHIKLGKYTVIKKGDLIIAKDTSSTYIPVPLPSVDGWTTPGKYKFSKIYELDTVKETLIIKIAEKSPFKKETIKTLQEFINCLEK